MWDQNKIEGTVHGSTVQAQVIHGNVHLRQPEIPTVVPKQLPRGVAPVVGRDDQLAALNLLVDEPGSMAVISGTAGIGKTTLCLHWARSVVERFPDGQLYIDLRGFDPVHAPLSVAEVVRGFLDGFGVPPERVPFTLDAQISLYRSVVADRRVLVVLDNAREEEQVRDLLPGGSRCLVIVTSRTDMTGLVVREGVQRIGLDLLGDSDSRQLISGRLASIRTDAEAVAALAAECSGLPLALAIVAGRAAQNRSFPLSALIDELRSETRKLDGLDTGDPYTTARSVFSWSYRALPTAAQRMFRLLGLPTAADIALPAAASLADIPLGQARSTLIHLSRANLVEEYVPGRFRFHDLLREYAAERLASDESEHQREAAARRLVDSYLHTALDADAILSPHRLRIAKPPVEPGTVVVRLSSYDQAISWCSTEHHVVVGAVEHAFQLGLERQAWQLAWALVTYLRRLGHHRDRVATQRLALEAAQRLGDGYAEAKIARVLGKTLVHDGQHWEAEVFHERAVVLFRQLDEPAEESDALLGRGRVRHRQNRIDEAVADARRALALAECADNTNLRATALNALGWYAIALDDPEEAIRRCSAALLLYREIDNSEGAADVLRVLGLAHHHLGRHDEAVTHYEASLELDLALGDQYYTALVLSQTGDAHLAAGRKSMAVAAWRRSLGLLEYLSSRDAEDVRAKLLAAL